MSVTQEIKSRLDIVDIVSDYLPLRKSGRNYAGFCPFHQNTRTPAFYVFPETQTWRCFGACADGGDIFSFVMRKEGWDFREALEQMARKAGVTLEDRKPVDIVQRAAEQKMTDLLKSATDYFHMLLLHAPQAEMARRYVGERQLNEETLATYQIGFALNSWEACRSHFNDQGYDDEDLLKAGLLTESEERGTRYDRFRNRLMIPIRDVNGRVVGFGARTLEKDGIPKYLNSPQTKLFDKSSLLYGIDMAKRHVREARQVIIVEGYMDVMQGWQAGYRNMVAQMGTALTERQLQLLKRYTKRFILALDADAAGIKATMRGLQVARETLDHELEIHFDARGLVRQESRLQADIQVAVLPEGNDPDKIIRTNPAQWPQILEQARPVVAYVIEVMTADLDMKDAKGKTAVAQQVIPLIKDIEDPVERDHYWQQLARTLGVDERSLRQVRLPEVRRSPSLRPQNNRSTPQMPPEPDWGPIDEIAGVVVKTGVTTPRAVSNHLREANFLRQCLNYPQMLTQVNHSLHQLGQTAVNDADFVIPEDKLLLQHIYHALRSDTFVTVENLCDSLEDEILLNRVQSLNNLTLTPKTELDRLPDTLVLSVLQWRRSKVTQLSGEIQQLVNDASNEKDDDAVRMYQKQVYELTLTKRQIDQAIAAMSAVNRRRAEDSQTN